MAVLEAYKILSTDPLVDSDDEAQGEAYTREDYSEYDFRHGWITMTYGICTAQRLKVINHLSCQRWASELPTSANNPL